MSEKITTKDRISEVYDKYVKTTSSDIDLKHYFISDIIEIIERSTIPQNFCEDCDERIFNGTCINCGKVVGTPVSVTLHPDETTKKVLKKLEEKSEKGIGLPDSISALIENDEKEIKAAATPSPRKKSIAEKMTALKAKIDGGGAASAADNEMIRSQDPSIRGDVNWV